MCPSYLSDRRNPRPPPQTEVVTIVTAGGDTSENRGRFVCFYNNHMLFGMKECVHVKFFSRSSLFRTLKE